MKKEIHPKNYRKVIFLDSSNDTMFLIGSTIATTEKGKYDGKEYDLTKVEITSSSHPYYTGNEKVLDSAGRVEKFKARRSAAKPKKEPKVRVKKSEEKSSDEQ